MTVPRLYTLAEASATLLHGRVYRRTLSDDGGDPPRGLRASPPGPPDGSGTGGREEAEAVIDTARAKT